MKTHDTYIIEYENGQWWTYVYVPSIHNNPDHPYYLLGSEEVFDTLEDAADNIKEWRTESLWRQYVNFPQPSPDERLMWEDFGEYHVDSSVGQLTTNSFDEALSLACIESSIERNIR
jgi:hypothetical protein